jgi:CYTH domain-containing protein
MDDVESKYTRIVCERRFLVIQDANWKASIASYHKTLEDRYIRGTSLRLRVQTDSDTGRRLIKLTKKFESESAYYQTVGRILLSPGEYELFAGLEADCIRKTRHYHDYRGRVFSIDVFEGELAGLLLCEIESEDVIEIMTTQPPPYAGPEVTGDVFFTGGSLCRVNRDELSRKLLLLYSAT